MKKLTNFFNCAANGLQKTGGGTSQTRGRQLGVASVITSTLSRFDCVSLANSRSACAPRTLSLFEAISQMASPHLRVFDNIRGISALFSPRVYRYAAVLLMVFMVGIGNAWGEDDITTYTFTAESVLTNAFDVTVNDASNVVRTFNDNGLNKYGDGTTYSTKQLKIELKNNKDKTFTAISKSAYTNITKVECDFGAGSSARGNIKLGVQVSTNKNTWTAGTTGVTTIVSESDTWQNTGKAFNEDSEPENSKMYTISHTFATPVTGYVRLFVTNTSSGKTVYFGPLKISTSSGGTTPAAPAITVPASDPDLQTITQGETKTFEVTATGYPTPSFKWYKNTSKSTSGAEEIEGATTNSYTTSASLAAADDPYYFYCVATNASGSAQSPYFSLQVDPLGADLTAHTPGVYTKAQDKGGYGAELITSGGRQYETYYMYSSSGLYLSAGNIAYNATGHYNVIDKKSPTDGTAKASWVAIKANNITTSVKANTSQFNINVNTAYVKLRNKGTETIRLKVSGYDEFAFYGANNNNSDATKQFLIKIDGEEVTNPHASSNSDAIFAFTFSTEEHYIEISVGGNTSSDSKFYAFSLRLPEAACSAPTSPTITATPASAAYTEGDNISLTASATGTDGSTTYTWYKGATWDAASATSSIGSAAIFTKNSCVEGDAGTYWCNISNGTGCEVQVSKTITVAAAPSCSAPTITTDLSTTQVEYNKGATATALEIVATGDALTYQWYSNTSNTTEGGTSLGSTAQSASYTPSTAAIGTKYYYCVVSSGVCTTTSAIANIKVNAVRTPGWVIFDGMTDESFAAGSIEYNDVTVAYSVAGNTMLSAEDVATRNTHNNFSDEYIPNAVKVDKNDGTKTGYLSFTIPAGYKMNELILACAYAGSSRNIVLATSAVTSAEHADVITSLATGGNSDRIYSVDYTPAEALAAGTYYMCSPVGGTWNIFHLQLVLEAAAPACSAPTSVTIAATPNIDGNYGWRYSLGETIDLTCSYTGGTGTPSYQWQKYVENDWVDISTATNASAGTARLQIANCTSGDGGSYRCVVSMGTSCDLVSDGYFLRVFTLNGNYNDDTWSENAIVWTGEFTGTATLNLNASSLYKFKVTDNNGKWFGNGDNNIILSAINWDCGINNSECRLFTGPAGNYVATIDITHAAENSPYVNVQLAYPSVTHPAAGYSYFEKPNEWTNVYLYWYTSDGNRLTDWDHTPEITTSTTICEKTYYYSPLWDKYDYVIYKGNGTNQWPKNTQLSTTGCSGKYLDKTDYNAPAWASFATYTISFAGNGNTSGEMSAISGICPAADQALTANAFEKTGYNFTGWVADVDVTVGGVTVSAGTVIANEATIQNISSNIALTAQWTIDCPTEGTVYSLLLKDDVENASLEKNGGTLNLTSTHVTVTNGASALIKNTDTDNDDKMQIKSHQFYFNGNKAYLKIEMLCALEAGDEIEMTGGKDSREFYITPNECAKPSDDADAVKTSSYKYTVKTTDTKLVGVSTLYIGRDGSGTYTTGVKVTRPEKFDVTYWKNDGSETKTEAEGSVVADNEFTRSGYRFIEWNTQADGKGTTKVVGAAVTADIELYAIWAQEYSVSYANTGAASGAAPTNANKYITGETFKVAGVGTMEPAENYVFGGWNDGNATYAENDDYTVGTANVSFAPVWNLQYSVTYNANGGTLPSGAAASAIVANNPSTITQCQFLPEDGKVFAYWTDDEEGEGTQYLPGASISTTKVLYAQYEAVACADRQSITKAVLTSASAATTSGYNNKEYAGDAKINGLGGDGGSQAADLGDGEVTGYKLAVQKSILFATLAKGSFQTGDQLIIGITKASGGEGQQVEIYAGSDKDNVLKVINLDNISAAGYYRYTLTAADAAAINAAGYKSIGLYRSLGSGGQNPYVYSVELTGCRDWVIKHTVTFELNGQTGTAPTAQSIAEGGLVTKPADPEVAGQFFRGWFTDEECTAGNEWDFANDAVGESDMTLYAKWEADPCTSRQSIVKVVMTGANAASSAGYNNNEYAADAVVYSMSSTATAEVDADHEGVETGYKMNGNDATLFAVLEKGTFQEGDKVKVAVTKINDNYKEGGVAQQILDIYFGNSNEDATFLTTIEGVSEAGVYTYTLKASDITAIGSKKGIGVYRPSSGRVQNPFIYSVEVTGCRDWTVYHTLTFKNADGSATIAAPALAEGAYASTVAPSAPRVKGKRFLGWSESVAGDIVNMEEYTITEDKILYIIYEDVDCPTFGTIYKFLFKTDLTNGNLDAATNADMSEYVNASGDGYLAYTSTSAGQGTFANDSLIQFTNTAAYLKVDLDCALAAGDRIRVRCYGNPITVQVGTSYDSSKDLKFEKNDFGWQDITETMVGKSDLYITRASNGNAKLAYFEIYRRPALTGVTMDDMRLKIGKTGTPVLHLLPADDAIVTSQAWEITASTATGTTINAETGLITAGTTTGEMTVQVTLNGDKVASATVAIVQGFEAVVPVTATTTWDWTPVSTTKDGPTISAPDTVLANYISGAGWENLAGNVGAYVYRDNSSYKAFQGTKLSFKAAVPGKLKIYAGRISENKKVYVNGIEVGTVTSTKAYLSEIVVPAGYVAITSDAMRIYNMTFDADLVPDQAEESFLGGYERTVDPQYYGTVCLPKAGVMTGATLFKVAYMDYKEDGVTPYKVYYDEVENGTMQAGMPYIFLAEQSTIGVYYTGTAEETAKDHNGLHGTLVNITEGMNAAGIYMLYNNRVLHSTNPTSYLNANRAYIQLTEVPGYGNPNYQVPAPTRRRISTGFNGANGATGLENIQAVEGRVQKVLIDGKIYILRGEKIFDATGRLVK